MFPVKNWKTVSPGVGQICVVQQSPGGWDVNIWLLQWLRLTQDISNEVGQQEPSSTIYCPPITSPDTLISNIYIVVNLDCRLQRSSGAGKWVSLYVAAMQEEIGASSQSGRLVQSVLMMSETEALQRNNLQTRSEPKKKPQVRIFLIQNVKFCHIIISIDWGRYSCFRPGYGVREVEMVSSIPITCLLAQVTIHVRPNNGVKNSFAFKKAQ